MNKKRILFISFFLCSSVVCFFYFGLYVTSFTQDNPSLFRPYMDRGFIDKDKKRDFYLLTDCTMYDDQTVVVDFPGSLCEFVNEDKMLTVVDEHLIMLNSKQETLWKKHISPHHYIAVNRRKKEIVVVGQKEDERYDIVDGIFIYNYEGEQLFEWYVTDVKDELGKILNDDIDILYQNEKKKEYGIIRTFFKINSADFVGENSSYPAKSFLKPDNLIINIQSLSLHLIIDRKNGDVAWSHVVNQRDHKSGHAVSVTKEGSILYYSNFSNIQGPLTWGQSLLFYLSYYPHTFWDEGEVKRAMFYFDDGTELREALYSSIIKYEPDSKKVSWVYNSPYRFYYPTLGYLQLLENGNYLVTNNSFGGSVFELTPDKRIEWEWYSVMNEKPTHFPRTVYRAAKIDKKMAKKFIDNFF